LGALLVPFHHLLHDLIGREWSYGYLLSGRNIRADFGEEQKSMHITKPIPSSDRITPFPDVIIVFA
jgi:hypothetical protein